MSVAQLLSDYVTVNLLVTVAYVALMVWRRLAVIRGRPVGAGMELRVHYLMLLLIIVIATVQPWLGGQAVFQPAAKVWSAESWQDVPAPERDVSALGNVSLPFDHNIAAVDVGQVGNLLLLFAMIVLVFGSVRLLKAVQVLRTIRRRSYLVRQIGRVKVLVNDDIAVPFSYWLPGGNYVVVPTALMANHLDYRMVVGHELQHHRQMDTRWVYVIWLLRLLCLFNPFIYLWGRCLAELQEFACDETLVDRNRVESRQYMHCLVEVAQSTVVHKYVPVGATGLVVLHERNLLQRRIERMMSTKSRMTKSMSWGMGGLVGALLAATAFASQGMVQDRRVSLAEAQVMAANIQGDSEFPVVVNDLVLTQLNRYVGTPEGREFMRLSLQRMANYRTMIEDKIGDYEAPLELAAMPIVESGYQNLSADPASGGGAGIWMFLAPTARHYGLRVDSRVDERLDTSALTDAAMRYLKAGKLQFNDWLLAVLSFNIGDNKVREGIEATGSRDAWELVRRGYENDQDYLAKVMATILIMRNPDVVD